jgi:hypothetical protein
MRRFSTHGRPHWRTGLLLGLLLAPLLAARALGQGAPAANWPTSPFHGVLNGTGEPIPCRCRFQGSAFPLGTTLCMNTHLGVQLARCDLFLNNTTWVPTGVPCILSTRTQRIARQ